MYIFFNAFLKKFYSFIKQLILMFVLHITSVILINFLFFSCLTAVLFFMFKFKNFILGFPFINLPIFFPDEITWFTINLFLLFALFHIDCNSDWLIFFPYYFNFFLLFFLVLINQLSIIIFSVQPFLLLLFKSFRQLIYFRHCFFVILSQVVNLIFVRLRQLFISFILFSQWC